MVVHLASKNLWIDAGLHLLRFIFCIFGFDAGMFHCFWVLSGHYQLMLVKMQANMLAVRNTKSIPFVTGVLPIEAVGGRLM